MIWLSRQSFLYKFKRINRLLIIRDPMWITADKQNPSVLLIPVQPLSPATPIGISGLLRGY
jgi:hypothetical protein